MGGVGDDGFWIVRGDRLNVVSYVGEGMNGEVDMSRL